MPVCQMEPRQGGAVFSVSETVGEFSSSGGGRSSGRGSGGIPPPRLSSDTTRNRPTHQAPAADIE